MLIINVLSLSSGSRHGSCYREPYLKNKHVMKRILLLLTVTVLSAQMSIANILIRPSSKYKDKLELGLFNAKNIDDKAYYHRHDTMCVSGNGLNTTPLAPTELPQIIISEVTHPSNGANAKFVEIYNPTTQVVNLNNVYLQKQANGSSTSLSGFSLSGVLQPNSTYVCANEVATFLAAYGFNPDVVSGVIDGNGDDAYILRDKDENGDIIDIYGVWNEDGTNKPWDYYKSQAVRKPEVTQGTSTWNVDEWVIVKSAKKAQMTPGEHKEDKVWEGNTDTDWDKEENWAAINARHFLPDASSNVTIPGTATNQPILSSHAIVNDLTVNDATSVLTVNPANSIEVVGTLTTSQVSNLLLKADANGSAVLLHNTDNVKGSMEVYYPNLNKWYYIGAPISDALSGLYLGEYLYSWDETQSEWQNIVPEDISLLPATGYAVEKKSNNIVTYEGSFNNGNITSPDITSSNATSEPSIDGWNLLSNPYPSVIDIKQLTFPADVTAGVSVFRHGDYGYTVYSQGGGGDDEARYIQPGQAFMVKSSAATAQQLSFTNALRTSAQIGALDKSKADSAQKKETLCLSLYSKDTLKDKTYISFREGATDNYDSYYDMYKIQGATAHLFSYLGQSADAPQLAINSIPYPQIETKIPLGVTIEPGNYMLKTSQLDEFESTQGFYVFDKQMNKHIDLRAQPEYVFVVNEGDNPYRFDLYFYKPEQVEDMQTEQDLFYLAQDRNALYIKSYTDTYEDLFVEVVNVLGQKVYQNTRYQLSQPIVLPEGQQMYLVTIHANQDKYVYKVIMK